MHRIAEILIGWHRRSRLRRLLATVDPRSLRDAGIDPGLADYEAAQPFWRPPVNLRGTAPVRPVPDIANDHALPAWPRKRRVVAASRI